MSQDYEHHKPISKRQTCYCISAILFTALSLITSQILVSVPLKLAYAETGVGKDVFKVVVSIFGVTRETGDIAAAVTVDGNSKVRSYDVDNMNLQGGDADIIEFVATFPGTPVTTGDQYNACVLILKTMDKYCEEGHNSPAKRPEFVDITVGKEKKVDVPKEEKNSKVKVKVKDDGLIS